jgi:hypothetical protein
MHVIKLPNYSENISYLNFLKGCEHGVQNSESLVCGLILMLISFVILEDRTINNLLIHAALMIHRSLQKS